MNDQRLIECPLCNMVGGLKSVLTHVSRHMEELSLFALPRLKLEETEQGIASNASGSVSEVVDPSLIYDQDHISEQLVLQERQTNAVSYRPISQTIAILTE